MAGYFALSFKPKVIGIMSTSLTIENVVVPRVQKNRGGPLLVHVEVDARATVHSEGIAGVFRSVQFQLMEVTPIPPAKVTRSADLDRGSVGKLTSRDVVSAMILVLPNAPPFRSIS